MTSSRRTFLALSGLSMLAAAGCGTASGSGVRNTRTLRYQGSAGAVTPPELAEALGYLGDLKLDWVGNTISGPQDIQSAASGQIDFGGAFNGAVVKLASRKAPIKAVVSYYGSDKYAYSGYYVAEKSAIRRPRDLIGKKVGMNTLGAHAEAMLDIYLKKNGLSRAEAEQVERIVIPPSTPNSRCVSGRSMWRSSAASCATRHCRRAAYASSSATSSCAAPSAQAPMC